MKKLLCVSRVHVFITDILDRVYQGISPALITIVSALQTVYKLTSPHKSEHKYLCLYQLSCMICQTRQYAHPHDLVSTRNTKSS